MHTALNFTGQAGPAGDTWLTKWTPGGAPAHFNGRCGVGVAATILTHPFNNRKGAGLVALLNDANPGDKGLAVVLMTTATRMRYSSRRSTRSRESSVTKTLPLIAPIEENAWYVVLMELTVDLAYEGHSLTVEAIVLSLQDPTNPDPNGDFDQVIGYLRLKTPLENIGLQPTGQVGVMASAINAVVDSSVTTWIASEGFEGPCSE